MIKIDVINQLLWQYQYQDGFIVTMWYTIGKIQHVLHGNSRNVSAQD